MILMKCLLDWICWQTTTCCSCCWYRFSLPCWTSQSDSGCTCFVIPTNLFLYTRFQYTCHSALHCCDWYKYNILWHWWLLIQSHSMLIWSTICWWRIRVLLYNLETRGTCSFGLLCKLGDLVQGLAVSTRISAENSVLVTCHHLGFFGKSKSLVKSLTFNTRVGYSCNDLIDSSKSLSNVGFACGWHAERILPVQYKWIQWDISRLSIGEEEEYVP